MNLLGLRSWKRVATFACVGVAVPVALWLMYPRLNRAPYPESSAISGISIDWGTHQQLAPGSGDWGITWAADDHQYTAWGNGGGFGGTNDDGRVFLGFARIEGTKDNYKAVNVWGGKDAENPATFGGKSYGIISVDGTMYMWRCGDTDGPSAFQFQELYVSTDRSKTWSPTPVRFTQSSFEGGDQGFFCPVFLQFGKDNADARDDYVYSYATEISDDRNLFQKPGQLNLMRAPKQSLSDPGAYEFFAGLEGGRPVWTANVNERQPVLEDPTGISHPSALYNKGLGRYLVLMEHSRFAKGNLAIYEGPEPWGPWATVRYEHDFGWPRIDNTGYMWVIPNKWLSADGREFVIVLTGSSENDAWNAFQGRFLVEP